ncbi:hypothetical protein PIB30_011472 [Stylosanthes scabra]|uniref:Terpene synthase N-terminal domain-containing protein n=1 Tax=Stylosanthes scabra TaxID=79078 RepID=A0ABU6R639_9FABA|nr:hypothetical protein [Stylosanthes scabra]
MASKLMMISLPYALSTTQQRSHFGRKTVITLRATENIHSSWNHHQVICASSKKKDDDGYLTGNRRSANYQPNLWNYEFLQRSHQNHHAVEIVEDRARKLEDKVRYMISSSEMEPIRFLEFIDDLHRLGLSYKFQNHINSALSRIHSSQYMHRHTHKTLHAAALLFRIFRQHAFHVSQDVFESFMDDEGNLKAEIGNDVQGMLSV